MERGLWRVAIGLTLLLSFITSPGVQAACLGTELQSLSSANDFITAIILPPKDVCQTLDFSNRALISVDIEGTDHSNALANSGQSPSNAGQGDILTIQKYDGLPFGVGTVIGITVTNADTITLISPEHQVENLDNGGALADISFVLSAAGTVIQIQFTSASSIVPFINFEGISIDDCQEGLVEAALSGSGSFLMLRSDMTTQMLFTNPDGTAFSVDTVPTLSVLGVESVTFSTTESGSSTPITTITETIADPNIWTSVVFPGSVDDENLSGVNLEFTYATGSISSVPMVKDILVTACVPAEDQEPCVCRVTGDPILETSDGSIQQLPIPGNYVLSQLESDPPSNCDHSVILTVVRTDQGKLEPDSVSIDAGGEVVRLTQEGVMVDGQLEPIPFEEFGIRVVNDPYWEDSDGIHLLYQLDSCPSQFGVSWDAQGLASRVVIVAPGQFGGFYQGLCGNCDGDPENDSKQTSVGIGK